MKKFAIVGCAGYIAKKHMQAIIETGNEITVAYDLIDTVGFMDGFSKRIEFCKKFEEFKQVINRVKIDYLVICAPNYLHYDYIMFGLYKGMNVICEKPVVLKSHQFNGIEEYEKQTGKKVYTILQLRENKNLLNLKKEVETKFDKKYKISLRYVSSRGLWYKKTWKNEILLSGGLLINMGIHFVDMLQWIFGDMIDGRLLIENDEYSVGRINFSNADVEWMLSIRECDNECGGGSERWMYVNGNMLDFNESFQNFHTDVYRKILNSDEYRFYEAKKSLEIIEELRNEKKV
jgi:UDP-N-acetyl-2-amino-2-deoxyglucuronate dehydrogenase